MRSLEWTLIQYDWCPCKKWETVTAMPIGRMPCEHEDSHLEAKERGGSGLFPHSSQKGPVRLLAWVWTFSLQHHEWTVWLFKRPSLPSVSVGHSFQRPPTGTKTQGCSNPLQLDLWIHGSPNLRIGWIPGIPRTHIGWGPIVVHPGWPRKLKQQFRIHFVIQQKPTHHCKSTISNKVNYTTYIHTHTYVYIYINH